MTESGFAKGGYRGRVFKPETEKDPAYAKLRVDVGAKLRDIRMHQGLSMDHMAKSMGYRGGTSLAHVESGQTPGMSLYRIWKYAQMMGYDMHITFTRRKKR